MAVEAAALLGAKVRLARRERRWQLHDLAERVGVTDVTARRIERGDLSVGIGLVFEAAAVLGVPLFDEDLARVRLEGTRVAAELALLPARIARPVISDDF
jgi:transcriptional regulator with XRE-family HTH domain